LGIRKWFGTHQLKAGFVSDVNEVVKSPTWL
jgi:hypothetical protein